MKPMVLMILDGFGENPSAYGNAIAAANMPNLDRIAASCPKTLLEASGLAVGLPEGQMGNSEVGHTNIGAGRVVDQPLVRITKAAQSGAFAENPAIQTAMENAKKNGTALHLLGLLSDGGVHSHIDHLFSLLDCAKAKGLTKVYIHGFLDGRDVPPLSGKGFVESLQKKLTDLGIGVIASLGGRYYGMDRDKRWERVEQHYNAIVRGTAPIKSDPVAAVEESYEAGITDEFMEPVQFEHGAQIQNGDSVLFFNFRPDRAREMTRAIVEPDFYGFERSPLAVTFVSMTQYDAGFRKVLVAYPPESIRETLGQVLSAHGLRQLRIAETEKYAHVTFFFNGGVEHADPLEDRVLISSPKVATYDLQPEMSAYLVTERLLRELDEEKYDVVILNYANTDMVGHTGVFAAAVKACEAVDDCLGKVVTKVTESGGCVLITADHGNADVMLSPDGSPFTAHSTNPVPFFVVNHPCALRSGGKLSDIAPTVLDLLHIEQPDRMTGTSLIEK